jgi:uncharacterized membrane protein YfcA
MALPTEIAADLTRFLPIAVPAAFLAGLVDSIGGGGGIVTMPVMLQTGLPMHAILGTNKGQAVVGATSSLYTFAKRGLIARERVVPALLGGFFGSLLGAYLAWLTNPARLRALVLVLLLAAAAVMVLPKPKPREDAVFRPARTLAISSVVGVYDGFFGPGTGTLLVAAFSAFEGDDLVRESSHPKVANRASNVSAMILFAVKGVVLWPLAIPMAVANAIGARIGATLAVTKGATVIRPVAIVVALALTAKTAWQIATG